MTAKGQAVSEERVAEAEADSPPEGLADADAADRGRERQASAAGDLRRQPEGLDRHPEHFQGLEGRVPMLLQPLCPPRSPKVQGNPSAKVAR